MRYRKILSNGVEVRDKTNYCFMIFNIILIILSLSFISRSFAHHYVINNPIHSEIEARKYKFGLLSPSNEITEKLGNKSIGESILNLFSKSGEYSSSGVLSDNSNNTVSLNEHIETNNTNFAVSDFKHARFQIYYQINLYSTILMNILQQVIDGHQRSKRHAGHHDKHIDYSYVSSLAKILVNTFDEKYQSSATSEYLNSTSLIAINMNENKILFSIPPNNTDIILLLEHDNRPYYMIRGNGGYNAIENTLQVLLQILEFQANTDANEKGRFHLCHDDTTHLCYDETIEPKILDELKKSQFITPLEIMECEESQIGFYVDVIAIHDSYFISGCDPGHDSNILM